VVKGAGNKAKRLVLQCINGVSSNLIFNIDFIRVGRVFFINEQKKSV
jgi:hypothetical protein